ncbi:hypothetical protein C8R41DRAFT_926000 [Lentinula lateritia]|uniref:Uncharacterized protein n=1 Tax=Lentinula lateritia TaxID=40482 RepID=A0ABQ8UZI6_9AGAR|nr:hypothetical protein C8R41DRAFT_926000 [Lentinula lateritia]
MSVAHQVCPRLSPKASLNFTNMLTPITGSQTLLTLPRLLHYLVTGSFFDKQECTHGNNYEKREFLMTRKHRLKPHDVCAVPFPRSLYTFRLNLDPNDTTSFFYLKNKKLISTSILDWLWPGLWIIGAHASWPEGRIVESDLVDVLILPALMNEVISCGKFIHHSIPSPHNFFDTCSSLLHPL